MGLTFLIKTDCFVSLLGLRTFFWFYAFKPKRRKSCCAREVPRKARRLQIEYFKEQHGKQSSALRLHACAKHKHAQLSCARVASLVKTRNKNFGFFFEVLLRKTKKKTDSLRIKACKGS